MSRKNLVRTFLDLLEINSPSKNERKVNQYVLKYLKGIADKIVKDDAWRGIGGNTGNIVAKLAGGRPSAPTAVLVAHMDTVTETSGIRVIRKKGTIKTDGTTILGADDKAGIAIMLDIAKELRDPASRKKLGDIELLFTPAEEIGLLGVTHLDYSMVKGKMAYVLDGHDPVGGITTSSPSAAKLTARVHGKTAHAGVEPEKGVNAIVLASKAISKMRLGRLDEETTANIGVLKGGKATNIVPELAVAEGEVRSFSEKKLKRQLDHMTRCFDEEAEKGGGTAEIEVKKSFVTYSMADDERVVRVAKTAAKKLGLKFKTLRSGGGSDANVLNGQGIRSVVVGLGYSGPHTENEEIPVQSLQTASKYVKELLNQAGKTKAQ